MGPIVDAVTATLDDTWRGWSGATPRGRAGIVLVESTRLASLCTATSAVGIDRELERAHNEWVSALGNRQAWASEVAISLACCGRADSPELETRRSATADGITAAGNSVGAAVAAHIDSTRHGPDGYPLANERLELKMSVPSGWVVVRSDTQLALMADASLQVDAIEGLGVDGSGLGTGLRIRRLRKTLDWTLETAVDQAKAALVTLGEETEGRQRTIGGSGTSAAPVEAFEIVLTSRDGTWATRLSVAGKGDGVYFMEMGCPVQLASVCSVRYEWILERLVLGGA